jgi:hypothetical protein
MHKILSNLGFATGFLELLFRSTFGFSNSKKKTFPWHLCGFWFCGFYVVHKPTVNLSDQKIYSLHEIPHE